MIKMLTAMAGDDFAVKPKELTDRFSDSEEKSYVEAGLAEYVQKQHGKKPQKKHNK